MRNLSKNLLVAHDAGGAEILCAWLQATGENAHVVAKGPAARVFGRESIPLTNVEAMDISGYSRLITGTSYGARLENEFIEMARKQGVKSVSVLDHWLHYPERFQNCGYLTLPDELWVCDFHAQALARQLFPNVTMSLHPNWYWEKIRSQVTAGQPGHWLLALENRQPRGETWRDSIDAASAWLSRLPGSRSMRVRPHPTMEATAIRNYLNGLQNPNLLCEVSTQSLTEDLSACEAVVGYQTTVLALAAICGKKAVSLVTGNEKLVIPLAGIARVATSDS